MKNIWLFQRTFLCLSKIKDLHSSLMTIFSNSGGGGGAVLIPPNLVEMCSENFCFQPIFYLTSNYSKHMIRTSNVFVIFTFNYNKLDKITYR